MRALEGRRLTFPSGFERGFGTAQNRSVLAPICACRLISIVPMGGLHVLSDSTPRNTRIRESGCSHNRKYGYGFGTHCVALCNLVLMRGPYAGFSAAMNCVTLRNSRGEPASDHIRSRTAAFACFWISGPRAAVVTPANASQASWKLANRKLVISLSHRA